MIDKTGPFSGQSTATARREPEYDPNVVFKNFRGAARAPSAAASESEARRRQSRMTSEDRMRGVVVEVRRTRTRPVRDAEESSAFRF